MQLSLELWNNKVYKREENQCFRTIPGNGSYFYKMAFNIDRLFSDSHMGFKGDSWLGLACPLEIVEDRQQLELIKQQVSHLNLKSGERITRNNQSGFFWTIYQNRYMGEAMGTLIYNQGWKVITYMDTYSVSKEEQNNLQQLTRFVVDMTLNSAG